MVRLEQVARLADAVDAPYVTDHLCLESRRGRQHQRSPPGPVSPELDLFDFEVLLDDVVEEPGLWITAKKLID